MGTNYYLHWGLIHRACHVGKHNYLDIIAICDFFREVLRLLKDAKSQHYREYLKLVKEAHALCCRDDISFAKDAMFTQLPRVFVTIYNHINTQERIIAQTEYDTDYDFPAHILTYCYDKDQAEFGGLRYSLHTDFF